MFNLQCVKLKNETYFSCHFYGSFRTFMFLNEFDEPTLRLEEPTLRLEEPTLRFEELLSPTHVSESASREKSVVL